VAGCFCRHLGVRVLFIKNWRVAHDAIILLLSKRERREGICCCVNFEASTLRTPTESRQRTCARNTLWLFAFCTQLCSWCWFSCSATRPPPTSLLCLLAPYFVGVQNFVRLELSETRRRSGGVPRLFNCVFLFAHAMQKYGGGGKETSCCFSYRLMGPWRKSNVWEVLRNAQANNQMTTRETFPFREECVE
jgi:hypothetical protein